MEKQDAIKEYLDILKEQGPGDIYFPVSTLLQSMFSMSHHLGIASEDLERLKGKVAVLPGHIKTGHINDALDLAGKELEKAQGHFLQAGSILFEGINRSVARYRKGNKKALGKPIPVQKTQDEVKGMMEALNDSFTAVYEEIKQVETENNTFRLNGRYRENPYEKPKEADIVAVLWGMRSYGDCLSIVYEAAYRMALSVEQLRPEASHVIKREASMRDRLECLDRRKRTEKGGIKNISYQMKQEKPSLRTKLKTEQAARAAEDAHHTVQTKRTARQGRQL